MHKSSLSHNIHHRNCYAALGQEIRQRQVKQWTGLMVCVGVGRTQALPGNYLGKKRPEFKGVCNLSKTDDGEMASRLSSVEVGEVRSVGRRIAERMDSMGITTVQAVKGNRSEVNAPAVWRGDGAHGG